jgi:hypothetical protein
MKSGRLGTPDTVAHIRQFPPVEYELATPEGARQTALVVPLRECDQIQKHPAGSGPKTASEALQTFRQKMPCLGRCNAPKRDTGGHTTDGVAVLPYEIGNWT